MNNFENQFDIIVKKHQNIEKSLSNQDNLDRDKVIEEYKNVDLSNKIAQLKNKYSFFDNVATLNYLQKAVDGTEDELRETGGSFVADSLVIPLS